jgi:ferrous iron transport protein A
LRFRAHRAARNCKRHFLNFRLTTRHLTIDNIETESQLHLPWTGSRVPPELLPLEYLSTGEWADVADVTGEPGWVSRLAEMGVRIGSRLRVLQAGSPCLLQVGESRLSVRADLAMQILVRPVPV